MVDSSIVGDEPCPKCRANGRDKTGNHLIIFANGNKYCNRCGYKESKGETITESISVESLPIRSLPDRKLNQKTCEHFGVKVSLNETNGEIESHYYPVTKEGKITGYKIRNLPKTFTVQGDMKGKVDLFGQNVCPKGGKRLLITGGELDCLSAWQMLNEKYPQYPNAVVSLPKGENTNSIKENLSFIMAFDEVIIYTDMDGPGRKAADQIAKLIGPKAKLMKTTEKDASDMLVKGKKQEFISAYFDAETRKPEGIITGNSISLDELMKPTVIGYSSPYPKLDRMIGGLKKGELTTLTAGSGVGKSTMAREIGYHLRSNHDLVVGNIFLEERTEKTMQGYIALDNNIPLSRLRKHPDALTEDQWKTSYNKLLNNKWFGFKHFGSMASEDLIDKMRYLAYGEHCDFIILDHLSMVMSGQQSDNERKDIDLIMTELAAFVNESQVGVIIVVHLSRNKGKAAFNEGGAVSLTDLRGSAALEQLSWNVIALERNQQSVSEKNLSQIRVLKSREEGWTGVADVCEYDFDTGRLLPKLDVVSLSGDY
jgi:twinkle protein